MSVTQPVVTTITALIVGTTCAVILATVGQSAAAEARILETIDRAGTRTIVVSDPSGQAVLLADSVTQVQSLDGVRWVIGLSPVVDVHNVDLGPAGRRVPSRRIYGALPSALMTVVGQTPDPGEALVGVEALTTLGAEEAVAGVVGEGVGTAIVGAFDAAEPIGFLNESVVIAAPLQAASEREALRQVIVMVEEVDDVPKLIRAVGAVVHARDPTQLRIETPEALVELRNLVQNELASNSRQLLFIVLGVGLLVIAITLVGSVSQRRRDYGRRRALGASRSAIVLLVLAQTGAGALPGLLFGTGVGLVIVSLLAGSVPSLAFTGGVVVLALIVALLAAVPPGLLAAYRDPVRILRVP